MPTVRGVAKVAVLAGSCGTIEERRAVSSVAKLMSAIVLGRTRIFENIESVEQECGCDIDVEALWDVIDYNYPKRDSVTEEEAQRILMMVSRPRNNSRT